MAFWKPGDSSLIDRDSFQEELRANTTSYVHNPNWKLPIWRQKQLLPVSRHRCRILYALENSRTIILTGETGSGKTTQIPQYLFESGWAGKGRMILCTQPRRIAAISVASRVALEMDVNLGDEVGYAVRFDEMWDPRKTRIKFCTDGILLRETMVDPLLSRYSVIMLDEAHERTLHTDIILGLIKKIQKKRPDLRVIISSATLNVSSFIKYFRTNSEDSIEVIYVQGRQHKVCVAYLEKPTGDYLKEACRCAISIHNNEPKGDILIFLPGEEEIRLVINLISNSLSESSISNLIPIPLYSSLPKDQQKKALDPVSRNTRKVIVATTVAETSLTIDGIAYVVDSGMVKLPYFNPLTGMNALILTRISKAAAKQRKGRAGRTCPGKCYRMYTEKSYAEFQEQTTPEIQRIELSTVVLQLKALGIPSILHFKFISPPSSESIIRALELLYGLKALNDEGKLHEPLGSQLAEFPLDPRMSKVLLQSVEFGCVQEALTLAAILSVNDIIQIPKGRKDRKEQFLETLQNFASPLGDHVTLIKIYNEFIAQNKSHVWCQQNFLNYKGLCRSVEVRRQLKKYMNRFDTAGSTYSCGENFELLIKCIISGFFPNAAKLDTSGIYRTVRGGQLVHVHPTSVFSHFGKLPEWIVFHEIVLTSQNFVRDICCINPCWLLEMSPEFFIAEDNSLIHSGSSGDLGLPVKALKRKSPGFQPLYRSSKLKSANEHVKKTSKLPIGIGKSKGGLRSQF